MSSRFSRRAVFPGLGLLIMSSVLLSACASGGGSDVPGQAPAAVAAVPFAPATAVGPVSASVPSGKTSSAASASATSSRGPGETAPRSTAASTGAVSGTIYGVSDPALLSYSAAVQVQQLQAIKAMGVTSIRVDASWQVGQPTGPGSFDFTSLDQVVASLKQVGLSADLIIDQNTVLGCRSGGPRHLLGAAGLGLRLCHVGWGGCRKICELGRCKLL